MIAAVTQFLVVDIRPLVLLPGLFLDSGNLLALLLGRLDLLFDDRDNVLVYAQIIVEIPGYEIIDKRPDGRAFVVDGIAVFVLYLLVPHVGGAELCLGLSLELRLLDLDADGADDALAAVLRVVVLLEEVFQCFRDGLPERCKVGSSLPGVLSVDE